MIRRFKNEIDNERFYLCSSANETKQSSTLKLDSKSNPIFFFFEMQTYSRVHRHSRAVNRIVFHFSEELEEPAGVPVASRASTIAAMCLFSQ